MNMFDMRRELIIWGARAGLGVQSTQRSTAGSDSGEDWSSSEIVQLCQAA